MELYFSSQSCSLVTREGALLIENVAGTLSKGMTLEGRA